MDCFAALAMTEEEALERTPDPSLRGALATKQSSFLGAARKLDCFAKRSQ